MTRIDSKTLAAQMLRQGKTVTEVVEATALEPAEVHAIAKRVQPADKPVSATLADLEARVRSASQMAKYPTKAQTLLRRAADLIVKADEVVAADAGRAELRQRKERLKAEIAKIDAELRGGTSSGSTAVDTKKVRAWAADNGIEVPAVGKLRREVVDAYTQAVAS